MPALPGQHGIAWRPGTYSAPVSSPGRRLALYAMVGSLGRAATAGLPTAIILGVLSSGGSAADGSLLVAGVTAMAGLVGPLVGATADRLQQPRRGYLLALLLLAGTAAALAIGIGSWPPAILVVIAGTAGLAHPMLTGAWSAQVRRIAPEVPAGRAYAVDAATYNLADILGPALVGIAYVYDASTPGAASLEVVVILYLLAAIALLFVPVPHRSSTIPADPLHHALRGLVVFWHSVPLRRTTIISTFAFVGIAGVVISAPVMGEDLAADAGIGALLLAVVAVGALIGSLAFARWPVRRFGPGSLVVITTTGLGVCMALLALVPSMVVAVPIALLLGFLEAPQLTSVMQVRDREAPAHLRSLVFVAAASLKTGAFAVGSLLAAALISWGWRPLMLASAVAEIVAVILGLIIGGRRTRSRVSPDTSKE